MTGDSPSPGSPTSGPWWRDAVVYQIYPRSFRDSDGDGVGDLAGIRSRLDHLSWLGVDAVWLSPFYRSPMADFGYDVSDYCDVDPLFGDLDDFDALVADAHARGLRVVIDWVPNHTSDAHPWFTAARSSREDPHRDWYRWRDDRSDAEGGSGPPGSPGRLPNNWVAAFTGVGRDTHPPAWTWDEGSAQWYLHLFLPEQPDLNWDHPALRVAMEDTLRFWMARGVDGFRVDVTHALGKDPALPDLPPELASTPISALNDDPRTHPILVELRRLLDRWPDPPERMMVGEVFLPRTAQVLPYYGTAEAPELNLSFNFPPLLAPWDAATWRASVDEVVEQFLPRHAWPTWVLSNHDQPRHRTRYGSEARARAAAFLLLGLPGTPFLYAGEELGLADAVIPPDREVDPGGRDGCRAPIPWDGSPGHGWAGGPTAWLPWPPGAGTGRTADELKDDPASVLWLYRHLVAARKGSPALTTGDFAWLSGPPGPVTGAPIPEAPIPEAPIPEAPTPEAPTLEAPTTEGRSPDGPAEGDGGQVLAWRRSAGGDERVVAVNFGAGPGTVPLPPGRWLIEVASTLEAAGAAGLGAALAGRMMLPGDTAALLRPAD